MSEVCEIIEWNREKNKYSTIKKYKHHKWIIDYADCPFCGGGEVKICDRCGEQEVD